MDKQVVPQKIRAKAQTFAILDKLSDLEQMWTSDVSGNDESNAAEQFEQNYKALKEQLFETFYTSSDIEDIIIDPDHKHHELVMRLYHEYMDDSAFFEHDSIEQQHEQTETFFYFTDPKSMHVGFSDMANSPEFLNTDLTTLKSESITELHTTLNVADIYSLQNRVESLLALLGDLIESKNIDSKLITYFLDARALNEYQDRLAYCMSRYAMKQQKYKGKLESIDAKLSERMKALASAAELLLDDTLILKFKRKASKLKTKILMSSHVTYRDLDLMHERLYSFYQHVND